MLCSMMPHGMTVLLLLVLPLLQSAAAKRVKETYIVAFNEPAVAQYTGGCHASQHRLLMALHQHHTAQRPQHCGRPMQCALICAGSHGWGAAQLWWSAPPAHPSSA